LKSVFYTLTLINTYDSECQKQQAHEIKLNKSAFPEFTSKSAFSEFTSKSAFHQ